MLGFQIGDKVKLRPLDYIKEHTPAVKRSSGIPEYSSNFEYFGRTMQSCIEDELEFEIMNFSGVKNNGKYYRNFMIHSHDAGLQVWVPYTDIELVAEGDKRYEPETSVVINHTNDSISYNEFGMYHLTASVVDIVQPVNDCGLQAYITNFGIIPYDSIECEYDSSKPIPIRKTCARCGTAFATNSEEIDKLYPEDRDLCPHCRKRLYITPYHRYQPHLNFHKIAGDDDLFLGVELEVDKGGEYDSTAETIVQKMNTDYESGKFFMWCSRDGSLNAGLEMITAPATLNFHNTMENKYKDLFKTLVKMGYRSHNTSTAGIHVHFSRSFYEDNEEDNISKLLYLSEKFYDQIVIFSRRDYNSLERYAKKTDEDVDEFIDRWNKAEDHDGHYYAINISNINTIEIRVFRGTLNIESFMSILEFVDKLVRTAKEKTINELQAMEFEELLTPRAKSYYESRLQAMKYEEV